MRVVVQQICGTCLHVNLARMLPYVMYLKHMIRKSSRLIKKLKECVWKICIRRKKQKYDLYGEYNDHEPCFPPSDNKHVEIELHTNLCAMDKIALKSKLMEIKSSEERAKVLARYYRDRCADLKTKVVQLNSEKLQIKLQSTHEKNQIRYFWRNKIIEGQSRSGRILRNGLNLDNNKVV